MIEGLSHITFIVRDINRMTRFLVHIFGAKGVYFSDSQTFSISREKFFLINHLWIVLVQGEPFPGRSYNHTAFKIQEQDFEQYVERVKSLGIEVREGRDRVEGEGRSLYFYDYDNHLFEVHTGTLDQRLASYLRKASEDAIVQSRRLNAIACGLSVAKVTSYIGGALGFFLKIYAWSLWQWKGS